MMLGLSLANFTLLHVVISFIGIVTGLIVVFGMFGARRLPGWTSLFLISTILTSVTGFMFPFTKLLPSHMTGIVSLVVLAICLLALYSGKAAGAWRWIYVVTAVIALWLNVFVLVVQAFLKVAALKSLAPTQQEPPFLIAQGVVLLVFIVFGVLAVRGFHPENAR